MADNLHQEAADALFKAIRDAVPAARNTQEIERLAQAYALTAEGKPKGGGSGRRATVS